MCSVNDDTYEEILTYNEILRVHREEQRTGCGPEVQTYRRSPRPTHKGDPRFNGSKFNVLVEWETGESMYEPLDVSAADDPVTCVIYPKDKGLLDEPGW